MHTKFAYIFGYSINTPLMYGNLAKLYSCVLDKHIDFGNDEAKSPYQNFFPA